MIGKDNRMLSFFNSKYMIKTPHLENSYKRFTSLYIFNRIMYGVLEY